MTGCSGSGSGTTTGSTNTSVSVGANMAGAQASVHIPQSAISAKPAPWVLSTPTSAVRSYLNWLSYAYRIATSNVATPTMGGDQNVRIDSYIQYNLENKRLIDQTLTSIAFGTPVVESTHTLVPTKEKWSYSYLSIEVGNKVLSGPYTASYDTTYTVSKAKQGWVVDAVAVKAIGTVK
jgi:hypothetical protein